MSATLHPEIHPARLLRWKARTYEEIFRWELASERDAGLTPRDLKVASVVADYFRIWVDVVIEEPTHPWHQALWEADTSAYDLTWDFRDAISLLAEDATMRPADVSAGLEVLRKRGWLRRRDDLWLLKDPSLVF